MLHVLHDKKYKLHNIPFSNQLFSLCEYISKIPRCITGKKLDNWENSVYIKLIYLLHILCKESL